MMNDMNRSAEPNVAVSILAVLLITAGAMTAFASLFEPDAGGVGFGVVVALVGVFLLDGPRRRH
jgi:hypothetical protein